MEEKEDLREDEMAICSDVKSTAVVKYCAVEMPARFQELQRNTNLNEPPANWLHGGSKWETYLQDLSLGRDRSFSSFKMAHCFPDLTGEIDVISDSENIKKLLKIPYGNGQVSMMVHRVGNTLLLDDFDVHKHLLRKQRDDWQWLRKFYYETVLADMQEQVKHDKCILKKNKSRDHLQNRNMFSKFLYYSMADSNASDGHCSSSDLPTKAEYIPGDIMEALARNFVPDPLTQPKPDQTDHQRSVVWTFEDLRMLIGSDLPIFGGGTHPCVSLRLRDMRKPINILTGIDYWLDNLMCNVPELVMCFHLSGIVQRYELMKTEDIPNLDHSMFSPQVVRDIAQNILSFLHSNATKEGHTYWLFKSRDDDIVKLYDLTTLCKEENEDHHNNPFSVPVGVLMYRVARNMRQNQGRKKSGTIRTLLQNSLHLLDKDRHSQVVTSAHYLLSDLYISDDVSNPNLGTSSEESEEDTTESPEDDEEEETGTSIEKPASSVEVQALCLSSSIKKQDKNLVRYPPIAGDVEQRCREAIKHISEGLVCLDSNASRHQPSKHTVEEQAKCDPHVVIPLHYQPIKTQQEGSDQDYSDSSDSDNQVSLFARSSLPSGTWHTLSKTLLLRKAALVYHGWAEHKMSMEKYSQAMFFCKLALKCFCAMKKLIPRKAAENCRLQSAIYGLLGDLLLRMVYQKSDLVHSNDLEIFTEPEETITGSVEKELDEYEFEWLEKPCNSPGVNLDHSLRLYQLSLQLAKSLSNNGESVKALTKRYGNVQNEIGVYHMNQAAKLMNKEGSDHIPEVKKLCKKSQDCFDAGIIAFETLADPVNIALLHSNTGRLMRLNAQAHVKTSVTDTGQACREFSTRERSCFNKAVENYQNALSLLDRREKHPEVWDSIVWELSSTFFTMATLMQDYAPLSSMAHEQIEEEVTKLMVKALDYCDCSTTSSRLPACQYRAATIHHRLASLYHNTYRNQMNEKKKKQLRTLMEEHYRLASHYFQLVESACELLRVQLERVAMCEYILAGQTSPISKLKTLHTSLNLLLDCRPSLANIHRQLADTNSTAANPDTADELESYRVEAEKLLPIMESRLQFVTLNLVKNASVNKKGKCSEQLPVATYKSMYGSVLRRRDSETSTTLATRCHHLLEIMEELAEYLAGKSVT